MNLLNWECDGFKIKMIELDGELYCTGKMLADTLNIDESTIRQMYKSHKAEFNVTKPHVDIKALRELIGYNIGNRAKLWAEEDMILIAILSKSKKSKEFRKSIIKLIKERATIGYVTEEEYLREIESIRSEFGAKLDKMATLTKGASSTIGRMNNLNNRIKTVTGNVINCDFRTERSASCQ